MDDISICSGSCKSQDSNRSDSGCQEKEDKEGELVAFLKKTLQCTVLVGGAQRSVEALKQKDTSSADIALPAAVSHPCSPCSPSSPDRPDSPDSPSILGSPSSAGIPNSPASPSIPGSPDSCEPCGSPRSPACDSALDSGSWSTTEAESWGPKRRRFSPGAPKDLRVGDGSGDGGTRPDRVGYDKPPPPAPPPSALNGTLHSMSSAVSRMQRSMESMSSDMIRTNEAVRGVTQRLKMHGHIVKQLHKAMNILEQRASQLAANTSPSADDRGSRSRPSSPRSSAFHAGRVRAPSNRSSTGATCGTPRCPSPSPSPSRSRSPSPSQSLSRSPSRSPSRPQSRGPTPLWHRCQLLPAACPCAWAPEQQRQSLLALKCPLWKGPRRYARCGRKLLRAAEHGLLRRVRRLLRAGADPNFSTAGQLTALHKAVARGHAAVTALLLRKGADANARTTHGYSPLHMAALFDMSGRCVTLLLRAKADVDVWNRSGRTPLHYAAESDNLAAVKALLRAGACKYVKNNEGKTPFHVATNARVRKLLLANQRRCVRL